MPISFACEHCGVEFETDAHPGQVFNGKISFIDPVLNPKTRTVNVRVIVCSPLPAALAISINLPPACRRVSVHWARVQY